MSAVWWQPSATEILALIGGAHLLVGRSHECDFPPDATRDVPVVTSSSLSFETSGQVDTEVRTALESGNIDELYRIDGALLRELRPDVILSQGLCSVCSIDVQTVHRICKGMDPAPIIVDLSPADLEGVLASVLQVGAAVGMAAEAAAAQSALRARLRAATCRVADVAAARDRAGKNPPNVAFLEWLDPVYVGGHWTPQLIELAGARHPLNPPGRGGDGGGKSFAVEASAVGASDPDVLILSPCGLDLVATEREAVRLWTTAGACNHKGADDAVETGALTGGGKWFAELRAVREGRVAMVDGNQMFNRPGPRLLDALEWLVDFVHHDPATQGPYAITPTFPAKILPDLAAAAASAALSTPKRQPDPSEPSGAKARKTGPGVSASPVGGFAPDIEECHRAAVEAGEDLYTDPATGYMVFTEAAALRRGTCCGRGCRHCPYGHWNVRVSENRKNIVRKPTLLPPMPTDETVASPRAVEVVFWSGGKDSYLALLERQRQAMQAQKQKKAPEEHPRFVLLTTFDAESGVVPEQDIKVTHIMDQARALDQQLLLVPLPSPCGGKEYTCAVDGALTHMCEAMGIGTEQRHAQVRLVFGDLHLADIRAWREAELGVKRGWALEFPLFGQRYEALGEMLWQAKAVVRVSAVTAKGRPAVKVGQVFDKELVSWLIKEGNVDAFGEHGEFHTSVSFED